jgi:hypothetical protein
MLSTIVSRRSITATVRLMGSLLLATSLFFSVSQVVGAQTGDSPSTLPPPTITITNADIVAVTEESLLLEFTISNLGNENETLRLTTQLKQNTPNQGLFTRDTSPKYEVVSVPSGTTQIEMEHAIKALATGDYRPTVVAYDTAGTRVAEAGFGYIELVGSPDVVEIIAETCVLESGREQYALDAGEPVIAGGDLVLSCMVKNHGDFARTVSLDTATQKSDTGTNVDTATLHQNIFLEAGEERVATFYLTAPAVLGQYLTFVSIQDADGLVVSNHVPVQYDVIANPSVGTAVPLDTERGDSGTTFHFLLLIMFGCLILIVGLLVMVFRNRNQNGNTIQSFFIFSVLTAGSLVGVGYATADTADAATLTGTGCTIAADTDTCGGTFTWEIVGATAPNLHNGTTDIQYSTNATGSNEVFPVTKISAERSGYMVRVRDGLEALRSVTVTVVCESGTAWDVSSNTCVVSAPPSATLTATGCTITAGNSTCNGTFTWNIQNAAAPNLYNVTRGIQYTTTASGNAVPLTIVHGSNRVSARDGGSTLAGADVLVEATCADGAPWNGTVCGISDAPGGEISATRCIIPIGESSCESTVSWRVFNLVGTPSVRQGTTQFSTSPFSGATIRNINRSNRTFSVVDTGSTFSVSTHTVADCSPGSTWNGTICEPTGAPTMPNCSFLNQEDRFILEVPYPWLLADRDESWAQRTLDFSLPYGNYNVSAFVWDGYSGRESVTQPQERFKVELYRGDAKIAETGITPDLPDLVTETSWEGVIASDLEVRQAVTSVRLQHAAYPSTNSNSLAAICVAFDCVEAGCPTEFTSARVNPPVCPFTPQPDRLIVHFDQIRHRDDLSPSLLHRIRETCTGSTCWRVSAEKVALLPPANYRVSAYAWDGYFGRAGDFQDERWKIQVLRSGAILAETGDTEDLDDSVDQASWTGVIAEDLFVPSLANVVRAENVAGGSVLALCAAFDCLDSGCLENIEAPSAQVVASSIVCTDPAEMPRFATMGGITIDANTAQNWVDNNGSCRFADDWYFQRAPRGITKPDDNAGIVSGWTTFGPTVGGVATTTVYQPEFENGSLTAVRAVWQGGHVPFAGSGVNDKPSAEMYCHTDVGGFDNLEYVNAMVAGNTYYCVAWNAPDSGPLFSGSGCVIGNAHSSCSGTFTWNIQNATAPNLYNSTTRVLYSNSASDVGRLFPIPYGTSTVSVRDGDIEQKTIDVGATCQPGLSWSSNGMCIDETVNFTLRGTGCYISAGNDTCNGSFTWDIRGGATMPNLYNRTDTIVFSTEASGVDQPFPIRYGENRIRARDNTNILGEIRTKAVCRPDLSWNGTTCIGTDIIDGACGSSHGRVFDTRPASGLCSIGSTPSVSGVSDGSNGIYDWTCEGSGGGEPVSCAAARIPDIELNALPDLVRRGQSATIAIEIDAVWDLRCTLYNATAAQISIDHFGSVTPVSNHTQGTRLLTATQLVTLSCPYPTLPGGITPPPLLQDIRVEVIPIQQEI